MYALNYSNCQILNLMNLKYLLILLICFCTLNLFSQDNSDQVKFLPKSEITTKSNPKGERIVHEIPNQKIVNSTHSVHQVVPISTSKVTFKAKEIKNSETSIEKSITFLKEFIRQTEKFIEDLKSKNAYQSYPYVNKVETSLENSKVKLAILLSK